MDTPGAKVRYLNADHSAIAETADIFVSKWNMFPLYRHHKNRSLFGSSPQLKYYKRNFSPVISGPNSVGLNTNAAYSVPAPPTFVALIGNFLNCNILILAKTAIGNDLETTQIHCFAPIFNISNS
jgi:hypothetical protein